MKIIQSIVLCTLLFFSHNSRAVDPVVLGLKGVTIGLLLYIIMSEKAAILNYLLLKACEKENRNYIKILQFLGVDINRTDIKGRGCDCATCVDKDPVLQPVLDIALTKDRNFLDFLIQRGLRIFQKNLAKAVKANDIELVKKYIGYGVNVPDYCMQDACFQGNKDMINLLLQTGLDINVEPSRDIRDIPIMYAYRSIHGLRILDYLIEKGSKKVSYYDMSSDQRGLFHSVLEKLYLTPDVEKIIENIIQAQFFSCKPENEHVVLWDLHPFVSLLCSCIKDGEKKYSLLHMLCTNKILRILCMAYGYKDDDVALIQLLLNKNKEFFDLALMKEYLLKSCEDGKIQYVTCLLQDKRLDAHIKTEGLVVACKGNQNKVVQLLCECGVDLDFIDENNGDTLLHKAACSSIDILDTILQCYDNPTKVLVQVNNNNQTVFCVGCARDIFINRNTYFFQRLDADATKKYLHDELSSAAKVLKAEGLPSIITFCAQQGIDFNERNKKGKRPVDIAIARYTKVAKEPCWNSEYFINKEKIMHTFMDKTEYIKDKEVVKIFLSHFPKDIIGRVLHYYHAVNVDYWVAKKVIAQNNNQYYKKTKQQKERYKTEVIMQANAAM